MSTSARSFLLSAVLPLFALACSSVDQVPECGEGSSCVLLDGYVVIFPSSDESGEARQHAVVRGEASINLADGAEIAVDIAGHEDGRYEISYTECHAATCGDRVVIRGDWVLDGDSLDFEGTATGRIVYGDEERFAIIDFEPETAPSRLRGETLVLIAE
jgi:hypothetical protein